MCPRKHILGQIWLFWGKNPNFYERNQKFWYPHNKKTPRHHVRIVFGQARDQVDHVGQYLAQNDQKCIFWAKNPDFYGSE